MNKTNPLYEFLTENLKDDRLVGIVICTIKRSELQDGGLHTYLHEFTNSKTNEIEESFIVRLADMFHNVQKESMDAIENKGVQTWN